MLSSDLNEKEIQSNYPPNAIAIIGMAGKFPKANDLDTFWSNLKAGLNCIDYYQKAELINIGIAESLLSQENFIGASGKVENITLFDAEFFDMTPREARLTDPQHRLFLEVAHTALENSGYAPRKYQGKIAIYAGMGDSDYFHELWSRQQTDGFQAAGLMLRLSNEKDYLATKVAYKLNLQGPAVNVNTACSSSLVAVVKACQGLVIGEADMALAGGISLILPNQTGYLCEPGSIFSQDGVCKAFDKTSTGTVPSSGVGIIVLKKLNDALRDGDSIQAVITGYAINNDGHDKASYAAPSLQGQINCIRQALKEAKTKPEEIAYIETHGTGTIIGDAIEIQALTEVFREQTDKEAFCALGSVKNNIGHAQSAAGVAGLIKTVYILKEKIIPPHIHYSSPNSLLDFKTGPFFIETKIKNLKDDLISSAVSSFGIGGTNAHVIVKNYLPLNIKAISETFKLIILSAKSLEALNRYHLNLKLFLKEKQSQQIEDINPAYLDDLAYTLQIGREDYLYRRAWICQNLEDAIQQLDEENPGSLNNFNQQHENAPLLYELAKKWLSGQKIAWEKYHWHKRSRIVAPTYPFMGKHYWHESEIKPVSITPTMESLEIKLLQVIAEALGYAKIELSDNFFDLGGDSLIAINIISKLETRWGCKISFDQIIKSKNMASLIQQALISHNQPSQTILKKLREGVDASLEPIFMIHPGNGSLSYYETLIQKLVYAGSIWGIENPILEISYKPFNSIRDMASHYIQLLKNVQKTGPYLLAGWSLGASVAFEMARQLESAGDIVKNVTLIDGWYKYNPRLHEDDFFYRIYSEYFSMIDESRRILIVNLLKNRLKLFMDYHPQVVSAPVTLIKAKSLSEEFNVSDEYNNWRPFAANGMRVFMVRGDHLSIFNRENVQDMIDAYNTILKEL